MARHTAEEYKALKQMPYEEMLNFLTDYSDSIGDYSGYHGQENYVGDDEDFEYYQVSQAISQAVEMLTNMFDFINEMKYDGDEEEE